MIVRRIKAGAAFAVCATLCACGGGGSVVPAQGSPSPAPSNAPTSAAFVIKIPGSASTTSSSARRPMYISANTGSVSILLQSVNGAAPPKAAPMIAKVGNGAPGCIADSQNNITCTVTAPEPAGVDVFAVSIYQSQDGSGPALASSTISTNVGTGTTANVVLSLGGVPAKVAFSPASLPLVADGAIHRFAVTVNAADASGATIVGSSPYQSPVSLQIQNDPAHALTLSTASVSAPATVVTVTYDSSKQLAQGQIIASDNAMTPATLNAAPLSINPSNVTILDDAASAGVTLSEAGFNGSYSVTVANPNDATVAVVPGTLNSGTTVATLTPKTHFDVTTLNVSDGNVSTSIPLAVVPDHGPYTLFGSAHQMLSPIAMIEASDGSLWSGDVNNGSLVSFNPSTSVYSTFVVDPSTRGPRSIAFDAGGNIWFADGPRIGKFTPSTATTTMFSTGLQPSANITAVIAGPSGQMWFYDYGSNNALHGGSPTFFGSINTNSGVIQEFPTSNAAEPSLGGGSMSMLLGIDNSIWFTDGYNFSIGHIDPSSGTITEFKLGTPARPQQSPLQLTLAPDGKVWFATYGFTSSTSLIGSLDPNNNNSITYYANGLTVPGLFMAFTTASDGNLYFSEDPNAGFGFSAVTTMGIVNPNTGTIYTYPAFIPANSGIISLVDRHDGGLWFLDGALGQIGKVTLK